MDNVNAGNVSCLVGGKIETHGADVAKVFVAAATFAHVLISASGLPEDERRKLHQETALKFAYLRAGRVEGVEVVMGVFPRAVATEEAVVGAFFLDRFYFPMDKEYPIPYIELAGVVVGKGPSDLVVQPWATFDITKDHAVGIGGRSKDPESHECYDLSTRIYTYRSRDGKSAYQFRIGEDGQVEEVMIPEPVAAVSG